MTRIDETAARPSNPQNRTSIVIVGYNSLKHLQLLLPSLQAYSPQAEAIVFDNASTDGTADFIATDFPHCIYKRSECNLGFAAGCNRGAALASRPYLVFVNPDVEATAGWLEALVEPLRSDEIGLTTAKLALLQLPEVLNTCGNDFHLSGIGMCRGMGQSILAYAGNESVAAVSGAAMAISRSLFDRLGGFDEDFFMYMEETHLSLQARLAGFEILYIAGSLLRHDYAFRVGTGKIYYQERNRYALLLQLYRWRTLILLTPALLLAEFMAWGFVLLNDRKNWTNKFRAYYDTLSNWRKLMTKRRNSQQRRKVSDRELLRITSARLDFGQVDIGLAGTFARWFFNPLFSGWRAVILLLVRW